MIEKPKWNHDCRYCENRAWDYHKSRYYCKVRKKHVPRHSKVMCHSFVQQKKRKLRHTCNKCIYLEYVGGDPAYICIKKDKPRNYLSKTYCWDFKSLKIEKKKGYKA